MQNKNLTLLAFLVPVVGVSAPLTACSGGGDDLYKSGNGDDDDDSDGDDGTGEGDDDDDDAGGPAEMIDDLEDGDNGIIVNGGRVGYWYTYNDESEDGVQTPAEGEFLPLEGGPEGSLWAASTSGSGFSTWGAGIGFDLDNPGEDGRQLPTPYDASSYTGISFMAKGNTPIRVKVNIGAVIPTDRGGSCEDECDDAHGTVMGLSDEWERYLVPWEDLFQEGWGAAADFDAASVMQMQWQVAADIDFEYWVDDVGFI